jgi:hypothetical protein
MESGRLSCGEDKVIPVGDFERINYLKSHEARRLVILRRLEDEKIRRLEAEFVCIHFHGVKHGYDLLILII